MNDAPLLIIVSGPPCTGKTTLAKRIAQSFRLPLIAKDDIKESLFDSLGWRDREWSKQLGRASYDLLYYFVQAQLAAGRSLIVEANLDSTAWTEKFRTLHAQYAFTPFQIQCQTDGTVLVERFKQRWASGARHPGHVEYQITDAELVALRKGKYEPMPIGGSVVEIDTTDFATIDYEELFRKIESANRTEKVRGDSQIERMDR